MRCTAFRFFRRVSWNREKEPWLKKRWVKVRQSLNRSEDKGCQPGDGIVNLPGDDGGPREEEDPDAVPAFSVRCNDFVLVRDPVLVPAIDSSGVVNAKDVDALDFEAGGLDLVDDPAKRAGSVGSREDVFVHEETPDEIFVLPCLTDTGDLEDEDTLVVEEVVDLLQESTIATDTDMLNKRNISILVTNPFIKNSKDRRVDE